MGDIFAAAEKFAAENADTGSESYVLFMGSKSSGKSTLVSAFLSPTKEESAKPTIGLDYTYGRRSASSGLSSSSSLSSGGGSKDIAHVWELGGGSTAYSELLSIVFTPNRLPTNTLVFVLDLSNPLYGLQHMKQWFSIIRTKINDIMDRMNKAVAKGAAMAVMPDQMARNSQARVRLGYAQKAGVAVLMPTDSTNTAREPGAGEDAGVPIQALTPAAVAFIQKNVPEHPDALFIANTLLPFQTVMVANKYDAIRDLDSTKRKVVFAALRYFALCFGASLVVTSIREKSSLAAYRSIVGQCLFGTEHKRTPIVDINKPLYIPAGADSLDAIGLPVAVAGAPSVAKSDVESGPLDARLDRYIAPVKFHFPATSDAPVDPDENIDPSTLPPPLASIVPGTPVIFNDEASKYPEPVIDMLRVAAAEETAKYVREVERKLRMEAKSSAAGDK